MSIYRIVVRVADVPKAAEFYGKLLGIEGRSVGFGRVYLDCGPVILALVAPPEAAAPRSLDYLYLAVPNLDEAFARAKGLGCLAPGEIGGPAGEIATRPWGERSFYVVDPWGNPLGLVDDKTIFRGK